ncbi:Sec39-domain-containing protein [Auriscalpium vulgare]|uniref:Sec39-domain-containing protein n=1 Tax=Auriscalpium vulgare TaxID=40419 RepID=A0ACB8S5D6_9AGAM|nr:Sec39-domain-containing protein [Auriscalpium vulgare]
MTSAADDLCDQWTSLQDADVTLSSIQDILAAIQDDLWVAAASADRLLDDVDTQRALLELGLQRTKPAIERASNVYSPHDNDDDTSPPLPPAADTPDETLVSYFRDEPADAQVCSIRTVLLSRMDRLNSFVEMQQENAGFDELERQVDAEWEDDPWEDAPDEDTVDKATTPTREPPFPLSTFLSAELLTSASYLASRLLFSPLRVLRQRHGFHLWPSRLSIIESIPEHTNPTEYRDFLPDYDATNETERRIAAEHWRPDPDWSELPQVLASLKASEVVELGGILTLRTPGSPQFLTASDLTSWYKQRVDKVLTSTGMTDIALGLVQHGAGQGVPDLDELGEELSLFSRLIYDAASLDEEIEDEDWTLDRWRTMQPREVVRAYLRYSTPESVVTDIRKLVMPYLFVLETRAERAGQPDTTLSTRLIYDYILTVPLDFAASIFESSKPILPPAQRLVRDDEDMARLALACLYGSDALDQWSTMSRIFECLPAWDNSPTDDLADEADTTVASLGSFVTPTTARPRVTPSDLLIFFQPLPATSLSRALDILDVHLESGEILSRWDVAAPLRWFLQSANNEAEQRARATRMARRTGRPISELDNQGDWEWLLEDILKLSGTNDIGLKSAFGLLSRTEVIRIFFGGLLSSGKFDIAKNMLHSRTNPLALDDRIIEDICLAAAREFYDNASTGNYRFGEMKLAYDCLTVAPQSENVLREQEFIEATSRITSFNVMTRSGVLISPLEIRLTKDRLSLVSRVLSSNSDAYKYTEVILDLVHKLGFRDDPAAKVKALAMIADTALQAEDFARAYETSETMVNAVVELRASAVGMDDPQVREAAEVCWVACFQLGRQPEFPDVPKKLALLGRALEFCPADKLVDILAAWRRLDAEDIDARRARLAKRRSGAQRKPAAGAGEILPSSLASRFQKLHMPTSPLSRAPDSAAFANTFSRVAATFPFGSGASLGSNDNDGRSRSRERAWPALDHEVSAQASRVLQKGIGWLIGADDEA